MDYPAIYRRLTSKDSTESYTETHHILPKCLGGDDSADNLVRLSWFEHRLAHLILVKMYPGNKDLLCAAWLMTHDSSGNRLDKSASGWLKEQFVKSISGDNSHFKRADVRAKIARATSDYLKRNPDKHPMKREDVRKLYSDKMKSERNPMKNKASRDKMSSTLSQFYKDNPDKNLMLKQEHRDKVNTGLRKWFAENPGKFAGENNPMFGRSAEASPSYGKRIINNGYNERRIPREEALPDGWKEGRLKHGRKPTSGTI